MKSTFTKTFNAKEKILSMTLILTILISLFPVSNLFAWSPAQNIIINQVGTPPEFINQYGTHLVSNFYVTDTGEIAYCADQEAYGPGGTGYTLNDGGLSNNAYLAGIQRVIQNGYPFSRNGLSDDDARYATQIAIHWLESYYLGGTEGFDYTIRNSTNANGHDGSLAFALWLFDQGVNGVTASPIISLGTPSPWTTVGGVLQCTVLVTQVNTTGWDIISWPTGVTPANGTNFSGNNTIVLQLTDPVAYAASDKIIKIQGYCTYDTSNIHVFTAGGGYQTMVAVSTMSVGRDPDVITLQDATGGFALHKVTQTLSGDIPEAGATFQLFPTKYASYADAPDTEKATLITDASGNGNHSGLPYGTYYLDQISAPTGVTLISRQVVTVSASSINTPVTYLNTLGYGHIDLTKRMNQAGTPYEPGATFRIYLKSAGSYDASPADQRDQITTDANGHAVTKDLPYGEYCMIQTSAAPGMKIDTTIREYRIGMDANGNPIINQTIFENIVNDLAYGRIEIHKTTDLTVDVPEAGAEFQIFPIKYASYTDAVADGAATAVITTDATGYAISPYLPFDRYVVIQSKAPAGTIPGFEFFVWIGAVDQAVEHVDLVNQTYWGTIRVQKYTVSPSDPAHIQTPESGATFQVYPSSFASYADALANDPKSVDTCDVFTTGADGRGQTTHQLPYGTYTVEQIDNAATDNTTKVDPWQVTIGAVQNGVYSYVRENPLYEQFLRIIKTDADTGEAIPIAGAAFEILDASNNVISDRFGNSVFYTDTTGTVDLSSLPLLTGTYGIRETVAPTGYAPSPDILYFSVNKSDHGTSLVTIDAGKDVRTVSIENKKIVGVLEIYKIAADTQLPMPGVVFEVYDKDGKLMDTLTTDAEGKEKTKILPYGVYTLIETKTLTGYILSDKSTFSIFQTPRDGEAYSTVEMTIANQKMGEIEVYKVTADGTSTPMNGVVFGVYDAKTDKEIARITTDKNGYGYIYVLAGNYYLKEISTWPGYAVSTQKIAVTGVTNASLFTFRVSNGFTDLQILKTDPAGTPLSGMEFTVTDATGKLVSMYYDLALKGYVALESAKIPAKAGVQVVTAGVTGADGTAHVYGLPDGAAYTITETKAPAGYNLNSTPVTITLASGTGVLGAAHLIDTITVSKTGERNTPYRDIGLGLMLMALAGTSIFIYRKRKELNEKA